MAYQVLSDAVVIVHGTFIVFVAVGGFLVWRWRWFVWAHVPSVVWGAAIIVIGFDCPLTPLEKELRERGGETVYEGGFVDRYVEGVVYPEEYTALLRGVAIALIIVAYVLIRFRPHAASGTGHTRRHAFGYRSSSRLGRSGHCVGRP